MGPDKGHDMNLGHNLWSISERLALRTTLPLVGISQRPKFAESQQCLHRQVGHAWLLRQQCAISPPGHSAARKLTSLCAAVNSQYLKNSPKGLHVQWQLFKGRRFCGIHEALDHFEPQPNTGVVGQGRSRHGCADCLKNDSGTRPLNQICVVHDVSVGAT